MNTITTSHIETLFTPEQLAALQQNHRESRRKGHDPQPIVHLRIPGNSCQWLITEIDEDNICFGLCDLGMGFPELGYISLDEILDCTNALYCEPRFRAKAPLSKYTEKARAASQIVVDWDDDETNEAAIMADSETTAEDGNIPLSQFLADFREALLKQIGIQTPVVYDGQHHAWQDEVLMGLKRRPFAAQQHRIHACYAGLVEHNLPAVFLNGEMGTGKTMMGICVSALIHRGYSDKPILVISPPHLVYKWRREILDTVPDAVVHVINGSNAINELIHFRHDLQNGRLNDGHIHYLIIGRVRMRMGFYWRPAYWRRQYRFSLYNRDTDTTEIGHYDAVACPCCGQYQLAGEEQRPVIVRENWGTQRREHCQHCKAPMWSMRHKDDRDVNAEQKLRQFLQVLPGIGKATIDKLIHTFGVDNLEGMIDDNIYDFVNLQTETFAKGPQTAYITPTST
ncbi:MAG: DUF2958 domain-containing protein, partial [Cardiobacteriaceae bacterium]|nr:DUF2958 domain-containing protein [Cardiobacteriaceae bacterium]